MKKAFFLSILFLFAFSQAFAVNFSPTVLTISAPAYVQYNFDGSTVSIPVKITGQPANSLFLVFTKDQGSAVSQVQNGYLGWHYVNKIDTCLYVSNNMQLVSVTTTSPGTARMQTAKLSPKASTPTTSGVMTI